MFTLANPSMSNKSADDDAGGRSGSPLRDRLNFGDRFECHRSASSSSVTADDDEAGNVMQRLNAAAAAAVTDPANSRCLSGTPCAGKSCEVLECTKVLGDASQLCAMASDSCESVTDGCRPNHLDPGTSWPRCTYDVCARRGKTEVDVAAEGIPIEVRRFQCTKSLLALKEATKNDSTPVPAKLTDFIVSLTFGDGLCTEREMCTWVVAQLCDRVETGQIWVIVKTYCLLLLLLWRGSLTFVQCAHARKDILFNVPHLLELMRGTSQDNVSGKALQCSLQPIGCAVEGQKSSFLRGKPHAKGIAATTTTPAAAAAAAAATKPHGCSLLKKLVPSQEPKKTMKADLVDPVLSIPEGEINFMVTNIAYMQSLCEYRLRHPTLDLAQGEIVSGPESADGCSSPMASTAAQPRLTPEHWKALLDDTLELIKAVAITDPRAHLCNLGTSLATTRIRNALLLYQVACRTLVRLLHTIFTTLRTFVNSLQTGLGMPLASTPPSRVTPGDVSAIADSCSTSCCRNTSSALQVLAGVAEARDEVDFTLSPSAVRVFVEMYCSAAYQFNRTVHMFKSYCELTEHVSRDTATKAAMALKLLPEDDVACLRDAQKQFHETFITASLDHLHHKISQTVRLPHSGEDVRNASVSSASTNASLRASEEARKAVEQASSSSAVDNAVSAKSPHAHLLSSPSLWLETGVLESMMAVREFQHSHGEKKMQLWQRQVRAVCALFDDCESAMLRYAFQAGLEGLSEQWRAFTNNGAIAAEKALLSSCESSVLAKQESSGAPGLSSSENGAQQGSSSDALTRSSTYILRASLPRGQSTGAAASSSGKLDLIAIHLPEGGDSSLHNNNHSSSSSSSARLAESSIEALLLEDDVVVICNEECSCNDNFKLVDRFQVLLDAPLGQGSYGKVFRAWDEVVGCYLAAKELPLDSTKNYHTAVHEVLQEYTVLTELSHPNIVRVVAFMVMKKSARIYMEWVPSGSLQDVLRHHPRGMLRESVVRRYARDVLSGLDYLHSRGVIHRDVKPGNMLLSSDGTVKLTDFGTSLVMKGNHHTLQSNAIMGTAAYMAPESVQGTYSSASDLWSFGCTIVQLITGEVPWCSSQTGSSPEAVALLFKIGSLDDTVHLERPHDALAAAVAAAAQPDGDKPSGAAEREATLPVSSSSASQGTSTSSLAPGASLWDASPQLIDLLNAVFVADRRKRPSARELLQFPFFSSVS